MNPPRPTSLEKFIDNSVLALLGLFFLAYSCFSSTFAEICLLLPFLSFPVFIGEILLVGCSLGLFFKLRTAHPRPGLILNKWNVLIMLFSVWILIKAFWGYYEYGPLAFRNAALFYYSWFAVLGYCFLREEYFHEGAKLAILGAIAALLCTNIIHYYYLWFYLTLFVFFVMNLRSKKWKYAGIGVFAVLFLFHYQQFFAGSRSHLIGMLSVFLYLFLTGLIFFSKKLKVGQKIFVSFSVFFLLSLGLMYFADYNELKSITTPKKIIELYQERDAYIKERENHFVPRDLSVQIYNPNIRKRADYVKTMTASLGQRIRKPKAARIPSSYGPANEAQKALMAERADLSANAHNENEFPFSAGEQDLRPLDNAYGNIIFRLLIWRDMLEEMINGKVFLGTNFGKPQRSKSMEITGWAMGEWTRDGWITPHNSFLHMIYRGGIFGAAFIVFIFSLFFFMTRKFISYRSFEGLLLASGLVYWIMLAQFLVVLELPYFAIPFWSLFGMALAHCHSLEKEKIHENPSNS